MRNLLKFVVLLTAFWSCKTGGERGTVAIDGTFRAYPNEWIYLEELDVRQSLSLDSVKTDDTGKFYLQLDISEPGFYILKTSGENYMILQMEPNEQVKVSSESKVFASGYDVAGSPGSERLRDFEIFAYHQKMKVDSLAEIFYTSRGEPGFLHVKMELDSFYLEIFQQQRDYVLDFIGENPGSLANLIMLNRKFGQNRVVDEEVDYAYFYRTDSALMEKYPGNKHVKDHHERVLEIKGRLFEKQLADEKLKPGNRAPEIVLKDTSGQFVSLKTIRNPTVLIYFWAGWNARSRQDNQILADHYEALKSRDIEVFGVSFDEHEKVWKGAVKLDKLPWINGSDLMGLKSPLLKAYNLSDELPYYYLLDEKRKILYRTGDLSNILSRVEELF